ncbi:MAG: DMT family transporter [Clostridia bacterium]|nr:DMT family transporter [Clostridia bacterium]
MQKKNKLVGTVFLLAAAILWGASFVFQNEGAQMIDPIAFNGLRSLLGSLALLPVIFVLALINRKKGTYVRKNKEDKKMLLKGGFFCGLALCAAGTLQTLGIEQGAGESGFITTIYIVFVPILGVFLRQKIPGRVWISVMMCFVGLYLLCGSFALNINQVYLLLCAFFFAIHILVIDYFAPKVDGVWLSCLQFFVVGIIDMIIMLFRDMPTFSEVAGCFWPYLVYMGVVSCAVAYTFQIIGQRHIPATLGALLMSLESVFSVLSEWVLQGSLLGTSKIIGCVIIFSAIILVQLPESMFKKRKMV